MSYTNSAGDLTTSAILTMTPDDSYGGLNKVTLNVAEDLDVTKPMSLNLKLNEAEDIYLVLHYRLE